MKTVAFFALAIVAAASLSGCIIIEKHVDSSQTSLTQPQSQD